MTSSRKTNFVIARACHAGEDSRVPATQDHVAWSLQTSKAKKRHVSICSAAWALESVPSTQCHPPVQAGKYAPHKVCYALKPSGATWEGGEQTANSHSFILALIVLPCSPLSGILDNAVVKEGRMGGVERVFHRHLLPACMLLNSYSLAYSCCTVC